MVKLMRNLLGDYHTICHQEQRNLKHIRWEYINHLNNLQEEPGFTFANKLKKEHLVWQKNKMNVKLAAQTFTASVAGAIDFLHEEVLLTQFQNSEAMTEFIKKMDLAFDLMNSRNPFAKGTEKPVTLEYFPKWATECDS